jgi:alpha-glucosidase (family GH31 glycosyl hydrolase)
MASHFVRFVLLSQAFRYYQWHSRKLCLTIINYNSNTMVRELLMSVKSFRKYSELVLMLCAVCLTSVDLMGQTSSYKTHFISNNGWVVESNDGAKMFVRPYGDYMIRLQFAKPNEQFFNDNHYDIIVDHNMGGSLTLKEKGNVISLQTNAPDGVRLEIDKNTMRCAFYGKKDNRLLLKDNKGVYCDGSVFKADFVPTEGENFLGFGQKPLGYQESLNLKGQKTSRNYGEDGIPGRGAQGNLLVPFFMSDKGYGVYMNSTFPNDFSFNYSNKFYMSFDAKTGIGQMDYVFVMGPGFDQMLQRYTLLTGSPRMLPKSIFGLHLSDNDPRIQNKPIGEEWWNTMISNHRKAGFPLDHAVFDNDWRPGVTPASDGQWGGSRFEYNPARFPNPSRFANFLKENGVTLTLDLNLNNCNDSWGWKPEYNMPVKPCGDSNSDSYPDYTKPEVRNWVWELFWNKAIDPKLGYPCDGLWIDESDGVWSGCVPDATILGNGRTWGEMRNYYYFLMGKAIVGDGWANENNTRTNFIGESKRPFVWIRGGTAGGQRYGTHWTGDIHFTEYAYRTQIIAMQASGLAAYPFFNHDAGGFVDKVAGPNDSTYVQWAMAFGSFTPIWRPHGYGQPRWPLNRSTASQDAAMKYGKLRYEMMPYIYSTAHEANQTGMPMARSMSMLYPQQPEAWQHELQYMWGSEMLVAPGLNLNGKDSIQNIWLPATSNWYYMWDDSKHAGDQVIAFNAKYGELPVFVKEGAIVPKQHYAQSTFELSDKHLILDVYTGADGNYTLWEDDGVSEKHQTKGEIRKTQLSYSHRSKKVLVSPSSGTYAGASNSRDYVIRLHGLDKVNKVWLNGRKLLVNAGEYEKKGNDYAVWKDGLLCIYTQNYHVTKVIDVKFK